MVVKGQHLVRGWSRGRGRVLEKGALKAVCQPLFACCCNYTLANVNAIEKTLNGLLTLMRKKSGNVLTNEQYFSRLCLVVFFFFFCTRSLLRGVIVEISHSNFTCDMGVAMYQHCPGGARLRFLAEQLWVRVVETLF